MAIEDLMKGHVERELDLDARWFNIMESPVQCSSDVWISPDQSNIIKKRKKRFSRPKKTEKILWEFLQYKILNRVFKQYSEALSGIVRVEVPSPVGVFPNDWVTYTEFAPGFILSLFEKHSEDVKEVTHLEGIKSNLECSIAFHLGAVSKIKELEGIYHHDYDLRHLIYDPQTPKINVFDFENTRYHPDKNLLDAESRKAFGLWLEVAKKRKCDIDDISHCYVLGRDAVEKTGEGYPKTARDVANELGIKLQIYKGKIDKVEVGLNTPRVR
jgi:hypothetical protein